MPYFHYREVSHNNEPLNHQRQGEMAEQHQQKRIRTAAATKLTENDGEGDERGQHQTE